MRYHKKQPRVERTCQECKTQFLVWASLIRHGKKYNFCSRNCFLAASRVTITCDHCGVSFTRQRKTASRYSGKNFCSRDCVYKSRRISPDRIPLKRLRYGSTEFRKARKEVIERDGMCQICLDTNANSVHHKNWNPYDNNLENLVLLCKKCHGSFKRFEDWDSHRDRIVACSDLTGNSKSASEMIALPS